MMRRVWPRSLAWQLIVLLLLALVLAQAISLLIFADERRLALLAANREDVLARTATIVRLLDEAPPVLHERLLASASTGRLRFWLDSTSAVGRHATRHRNNNLARRLRGLIGAEDGVAVLVDVRGRQSPDSWDDWDEWFLGPAWGWFRAMGDDDEDDDGVEFREYRYPMGRPGGRGPPPLSLIVAIGLGDGRWLNAETLMPPATPGWAAASLLAMGVMAVLVCAITIVVVRRITRPMAQLARAADAVGRGEDTAPLAEVGPEEIRRTTQAFNRMQARLRRFVDDRTGMLAAISHDLRTPLTSLRLRAEFVDDEELRHKILATLDEMQRMTEATLAFAREEAAREPTRVIDLSALVESVTADLADLDRDVTFAGAERIRCACRPVSLKRALRNLIENAVSYGERARVEVDSTGAEIRITIDDDGPGIPEDAFERVFEPFVRLEESRSTDTGGIGLGMAIARTIVRGHGGDIRLANRPGGGLRATVSLPIGQPGAPPE